MAYSLGTVNPRALFAPKPSSPIKGVYNPKTFIPHAASHPRTFVHWERFSTAASRRSPGSVSVPMWLTTLLRQLPVYGLVSHYLTNYLIGRGPLLR